MKSVFKAVATVTIFSVITRFLGFVFRIFLSRKLGAIGLGLWQMACSILGIFMTLISSGLPLTTAKLVSKYEVECKLKQRNQVVGSALLIALFVAAIASVVIIVFKQVWSFVLTDNRAAELLIIMIPSLIFSAAYAVFRGALWGQNDYFNCGLTELVEQIVRFALSFVLLVNVGDYFVATKKSAIAFNLACFASAIMAVIIYLKKGKVNFSKGEFKNIFKSAAPVTGVRLANSLVQPLTTLIIPSLLIFAGYSSAEAVASVGVVMGMTFPMLFVPMSIVGSISMVLIPSISSLAAQNKHYEIANNIKKSVYVSIFISMLFVVLYLSVGDFIGTVLYNNLMSGVLLQLAGICVLPIVLCNLSGSILNALNLEVKSFVNYVLGSLAMIASLLIFTPLVGINSIVISFFLSMTTVSLLNFAKIKKAVKGLELNIVKTSLKYVLIALPCCLLGKFVANIFKKLTFNVFACVLGGGIAMIFAVILFQMFNLYKISNFVQIIKRKKNG